MAPGSNFLIRFQVDLTKAEADLKRFQANAQSLAKQGIAAPSPKYSVPQIPQLPSFPRSQSPAVTGANLAAQQQAAQTAGLSGRQFGASQQRANFLAAQGIEPGSAEAKAVSAAQRKAKAQIDAKILAGTNEEQAIQQTLLAIKRKALGGETQALALDEAYRTAKKSTTKAEQQAAAAAYKRATRSTAAINDPQVQQAKTINAQAKQAEAARLAEQTRAAKEQASADRQRKSDIARNNAKTQRVRDPANQAARSKTNEAIGEQQARDAAERKAARLKYQASTAKSLKAEAQETVQKEIRANQLKAEVARNGAQDAASIRAKAELVVAQQLRAKQLQREVLTQARAAGLGRFESRRLAQGAGGGNTPGGFFGGGALSTLRYALPSAALFGGARFLSTGVKEAEELQRQFITLEAQLDSVGASEGLDSLRAKILDVAKETGTAADELAAYAVQLQGAFGGLGDDEALEASNGAFISGQELVETQIDAAAKLARISSLSKDSVVNDMTAASFAFGAAGDRIGDVAVKIQDDFGVSVNETLDFLGQVGPVAQEAGFGLEEFAVIAAITQQRSGRGGAALAEAYGRVLPSIAQAKLELLSLASREQSLDSPEFLQAVSEGDTRTVFLELAAQFDSMSNSSQEFVENLLGGRREAQAIIPALSQADKIASGTESVKAGSQGLLDERFAAVAETLGVQLERLGEQIQQVFLVLIEGGLGDILEDLVDHVVLLADAFGLVFKVLGTVDEMLGGLPIKVAAITASVTLLSKAIQAAAASNLLARTLPGAAASTAGGPLFVGGAISRNPLIGAARGAQIGAGGLSSARGATLAAFRAAPLAATAGSVGGFARTFSGGAGVAAAALAVSQLAIKVKDRRAEATKLAEGLESDLRSSDKTIEELQEIRASVSNGGLNPLGADKNRFADIGQFLGGNKTAAQVIEDEEQRQTLDPRLEALQAAGRQAQALNQRESEELLESIAKLIGRDDLGDLAAELFSVYDPEDLNLDQLRDLNTAGLEVFEQTTLENPDDDKVYDKFTDFAEERGTFYESIAEIYRVALEGSQDLIEEESKHRARGEALTTDLQTAGTSLEQAQAQFDAGFLSVESLTQVMDRELAVLRAVVEFSNNDPEFVAAYRAGLQRRNKFLSEAIVSRTKSANEFAAAFGSGDLSQDQAQIDNLIADLPSIEDPEVARGAILEVVKLRRAAQARAIAEADTAAEAIAIAEAGITLSAEERVAAVLGQLTNVHAAWGAFFERWADQNFIMANDFKNALASFIGGGQATIDDVLQYLPEVLAGLEAESFAINFTGGDSSVQDESAAQIQAVIDGAATATEEELQGLLADVFDVQAPSVADTSESTQKAARQRAKAEQTARVNLAKAQTQDPVSLAQLSIQLGQVELAYAENEAERLNALAKIQQGRNQLNDAYTDIFNANLELSQAQVAGDAVKAAQIGVQQAIAAQNQAKGQADSLRAQAQRIAAERSLADAIQDVWSAQNELLQAQANYIGDAVGVSTLGLEAAQANLRYVQEQFASGAAGEAELIRAEADVVNAQAAVRDAQLADKLGDFEFLFEMEKITKGQLIQYLQSLKQIPDLTEEQIRDIDRRIKALNDELGADLTFNLPTDLNIDGLLYQSRRLNQSVGPNGQPAGYQDNRTSTFNIIVNNATDAEGMVELIADAAGGGGRFGNGNRRY